MCAFAQNVPSYVPSNGLVGWWPFNGNANDESGTGNNGTVNGATLTTDRFGSINQAYNFVNSSIVVNNPTGLPTGNAPYTLSCWFNNFNNDNGSMIFYGDYQQNQANGLRLAENYCNNSVGMPYGVVNNWFFNDCGYCTNDSMEIKRNFWNHVLISYDGNERKLYLNNQLKASLINNNLNIVNTSSILFGLVNNSSGYNFHGKLDDIGIWDRALTPQEVNSVYNGNLCFQTITVTDTLLINMGINGFNPVTYNNTIKIFPNPTHDHITIDFGNYSSLSGYQLLIENSIGQTMFQTTINQQSSYISLSTWTGNGLYFVHIIDPQGNTIDIRKIILQ
jgi:hypothetical protein